MLKIDKYADTDLLFLFEDEGGNPIDFNGYTLRMQIRPKKSASALYDELSTENGRLVFDGNFVKAIITADATKEYKNTKCYFDIVATYVTGRKTRIMEGFFELNLEVTR